MSLWTQLLRLPVTAFLYGLDVMVRSMQAMQQVTQQIADPNSGSPPAGGELARSLPIGGAVRSGATTTFKEAREMSQNQNSRDQCCENESCEVRLFEYYIVSVKPDAERVIAGPRNVLVTDDMNGEAFVSWVIALYFQEEGHRKLEHEDKKYLRVCYRVACTFPKQCANYQKDQVHVLREIRDALGAGPRPVTTGASAAAP